MFVQPTESHTPETPAVRCDDKTGRIRSQVFSTYRYAENAANRPMTEVNTLEMTMARDIRSSGWDTNSAIEANGIRAAANR